ncbi:MAG: hypothetical protein ACI4EO_04445 [Blautia sp.]
MIQNEELPIGFTMELAMHGDILRRFSELSSLEQADARQVKSRDGMRKYVESMFREGPYL